MTSLPHHYFLLLGAVLFVIGAVGFLVRRNLLVVLMSVELMLNAVNLTLVAFNRMMVTSHAGQVFAFDRQAAGSHEIWYNPATNRYTTLPNHPGDLPEGTLRAILR